jgi:indoleamine 2,3-dioxygenase
MEYAGSYALFNYRLQDPSLGLQHKNLRLIRAFEHGLDPNSSEAGFVLVHVDMVANSGELIQGAMTALEGCGQGDPEKLDEGLEGVVGALVKINKVMDSTYFLPLGYCKHLMADDMVGRGRYVEDV